MHVVCSILPLPLVLRANQNCKCVDYLCEDTDTLGIDYMHVIHATMTNKERYGNCKCTKISPGISGLDGETYPSNPRPPQPDFGESVRYTVCPERNTRMIICPFKRCQQPAYRRSKTHIFVLVCQFSHRLHRRRNDFRRQVPKLTIRSSDWSP
jgi:hypothetical protein